MEASYDNFDICIESVQIVQSNFMGPKICTFYWQKRKRKKEKAMIQIKIYMVPYIKSQKENKNSDPV